MNLYSQKGNVSHGSKIRTDKEIKLVIQKPSQEVLIAKVVISLKAFAVKKKDGVPGSEMKGRVKGCGRWCIKVDRPAGEEAAWLLSRC